MKTAFKVALVAIVAIGTAGVGTAQTAKVGRDVHRTTLKGPVEIQGYPCAKGYAWFYADGSLNRCSVSRETAFGEAQLPSKSIVVLLPDGKPEYALMSHDTAVAGNKCRGGNRLLGPGEGAMTAFYPTGKLKECWLAEDQTVQGVPCRNGGIFGDAFGSGAKFYESGKLESCKLSKDFATQRRGDRLVQAP